MRDQLPHRYDHAWLLAEIVRGYQRTEMGTARQNTTSSTDAGDERFARRREQDARAREELRSADEATQPADERAHLRRADKAAYLRDKLAEAERSERED
ncbi:MAG TPA: hypothetical protein VI318_08275 [Baekduia sp.]